MIVPCRVVLVYDDVDSILFAQVEEKLLHVSDDDRDVLDAGFMELPDLSLNENFSAYGEQALGALVRYRSKMTREACCQDDGVINTIGFELLESCWRELEASVLNPASFA